MIARAANLDGRERASCCEGYGSVIRMPPDVEQYCITECGKDPGVCRNSAKQLRSWKVDKGRCWLKVSDLRVAGSVAQGQLAGDSSTRLSAGQANAGCGC